MVNDAADRATGIELQRALPVAPTRSEIVDAAMERLPGGEIFGVALGVERDFTEASIAHERERLCLNERAGGVGEKRRGYRLPDDKDHRAAAGRRVGNAVHEIKLADVRLLDVALHRRRVTVRRDLLLGGLRLRDACRVAGLLAAASERERRSADRDKRRAKPSWRPINLHCYLLPRGIAHFFWLIAFVPKSPTQVRVSGSILRTARHRSQKRTGF